MRAFVVCAGALALVLAATVARAGEVAGRVDLGVEGAALADLGPIAVYLEPAGGGPVPAPSGPMPVVRQRDARFVPSFLVVAAGQTVRMANDDTIFHNVFSFSTPNDFDLGLYPAGRTRSIQFDHPGVVRLYCSIHESMNATVFVSPTPWFTIADDAGRFLLGDVPHGRFRLRTWSAKLPETERTLEVGPGTTSVEIVLGAVAEP